MTNLKNNKSMHHGNFWKKGLVVLFLFIFCVGSSMASQLYIGAASVDITPPLPVALAGQMYLRVAKEAETPVTANIIALENREGSGRVETTIWVSVDLVVIGKELQSSVFNKVKKAIPAIDTTRIIINATHTHSAPVTRKGNHNIPNGVTTVEQTLAFMSDQIIKGIQKAWNSRRSGSVTWGLGHAQLAVNRRTIYYDGSSRMYGKTDLPEFRGLEGPSPNNVDVLFFWDKKGTLLATSVDVPCPAQTVEHREAVNADYWHPVREQLRKRFGNQLVVVGWIGAAGDQSPHPLYEGPAEERMRQLQGNDRLHQLAERLVEAVEDIYEVVKSDKHSNVQLIHKVKEVELPRRLVTQKAYNESKKAIEKIESEKGETKQKRYRQMTWNKPTVERYKEQAKNPHAPYTVMIHAVRLGDVAICTSRFELFTQFGRRIKARSKALQTFNIQLAGVSQGIASYLPTMSAVKGGGYGAMVQDNMVTPEAGQMLVDHTVGLINEFWDD